MVYQRVKMKGVGYRESLPPTFIVLKRTPMATTVGQTYLQLRRRFWIADFDLKVARPKQYGSGHA